MGDPIYFDNAATSWPKPPPVRAALDEYFGEAGGNPGRSGHRMSIAAGRVVEEARDRLAALFSVEDPTQIALTKNATEALNIAIYALLSPGDHAITSSIEHNSVMRPLRHLESMGAEVTAVACSPQGILDPADVEAAIKPNTKLIVTLHGSNVMGSVLPIAEISDIARRHQIPYVVDASQTAGAIPIDAEALGLDVLAFTGHKSLLGLTGTGGLYVRAGLDVGPLTRGGTGSRSDSEIQPDFMPDMLESGTLNVAGFAGLAAGIGYLLDRGVEAVADHERGLVSRFIDGVGDLPGFELHGPADLDDRCGVLSFNIAGLVPSEVGTLLDEEYDIMSRVGLHCAPGAHHTQGTFPTGSVRFGFSALNTPDEVDTAVQAVTDIAAWALDREEAGADA